MVSHKKIRKKIKKYVGQEPKMQALKYISHEIWALKGKSILKTSDHGMIPHLMCDDVPWAIR